MVDIAVSWGGGSSHLARVHLMTASNNVSVRAPAAAAAAAEPSQPGKRRTEVVIVGAGDETLIEVGPTLGDQYRTYSVDKASEIADLAATAWIGLYDATAQTAGRAAFAQLESQYGRQPWIVLCADEDQPNWRDVVARGGACAVIARSEISGPALAAALTQATQRLARVAQEVPASTGARLRSPWIGLVGVAVLAVVAGAGWWMSRSHKGAPIVAAPHGRKAGIAGSGTPVQAPAGANAARQTPQAAPASVEELLSMARVAFRNPATQLPKADAPLQGTSALELYGAVLLQQPTNAEALDGVRRLQSVARLRVQNAIAAGDADTAGRLLAILQHADFAPEELRTLEAAVAAARPKQLAAQARSALTAGNLPLANQLVDQLRTLTGERSPVPELRKELDARRLDTQLTAAAEQVRAAITAGTLLEPQADNARSRFLAMRALSRTSAQTVAVQHELLLALLHRVQVAIGRQDLDGAQQTLSAAQEFGSKAELADARGALDSAVTARRAADAASVAAAKAARASAQAAAVRATAGAAVVLSPRPRKMHVDYPLAAQAQNIQGFVVVEFTLNPNGSTSAAKIVESSPPGTFDRSALTAIKRATFLTQELADPRKGQRARFRLNYTLSDTAKPAQDVIQASRAEASQAPQAAASQTPPASGPVPASKILSPRPTRPLQVNYPEAALALNRSGSVVVEFMLNPDGTVSSPTVVESSPPKMFDNEAILAVKSGRFATKDLADPTKSQRARVKINFKSP